MTGLVGTVLKNLMCIIPVLRHRSCTLRGFKRQSRISREALLRNLQNKDIPNKCYGMVNLFA